MIKKYSYGPCRVWSFKPFGFIKVELVWAPKNYEIVEHSHPNQDIELIVLWGKNVYLERTELGKVAPDFYITSMPKSIFKRFSIRAGDTHWFKTSKTNFLFLNVEFWKTEPTSAAVDFKLKDKVAVEGLILDQYFLESMVAPKLILILVKQQSMLNLVMPHQ